MLPEQGYTRGATLAGRQLTGLVDGRTAVAEFRNGATVVFQGLHRSFPPLVDLIAELELEPVSYTHLTLPTIYSV